MMKIVLAAAVLSILEIPSLANAAPVTQQDVDAFLLQARGMASAILSQQASAEADLAKTIAHVSVLQDDINSKQARIDKLVAAMPAPTITSILGVPPTITTAGGSSRVTVTGQRIDTCLPAMDIDVRPNVDTSYSFDCLGLNGTHVSGTATVKVNIPTSASTVSLLKRSVDNPRYFADASGKPVELTGSHTWPDLQDMGGVYPPPKFDYTAYIAWMQKNNYNFMRLWNVGEQTSTGAWTTGPVWYDPHPYARTDGSKGNAVDGRPKFDVTKFNQAYFDRIRARVIEAGQHGIYAGVMLFEGWSLSGKGSNPNPWPYHPFNAANNINGINGDPGNTGAGSTIQTTSAPAAVLALQQAYVRKVIDTVSDLDNVLYEISNESDGNSVPWQYAMINFIKSYEAGKPKQHPVGMTVPYPGGDNTMVFNSPADWVSPNPGGGYGDDPPANDGAKVVIADTDHIWGAGGDAIWVWKSFTRGLNVAYMDDLKDVGVEGAYIWNFPPFNPGFYSTRDGMSQTAKYAARLNLKKTTPHGELSSTGYMLAEPGTQYLAFAPGGGNLTVNLSAGAGSGFDSEWVNVATGATVQGSKVAGGATAQQFTAPFSGAAALFLTQSGAAPVVDTTPTNTTVGQGPNTLVLNVSQDVYQGPATYTVKVDGAQIGGILTAHALHSNPVKDVITVQGDWASGSHTIQVQMLEDAWGGSADKDRNLYVESAAYKGVTVTNSDLSIYTTSPQSFVFGDGAPIPNPDTPPLVGSAISVTNVSGIVQTNYPLQFARPFVQNEIKQCVGILADNVPLPSQTDRKTSWPDGSFKHGLLATVIPNLPANASVILTFKDQPCGNSAPLTTADMLGSAYNFDAQIKLTTSDGVKVASARQMLQDGKCWVWTSGPVAQTMICGDHSVDSKYDLLDSKQFRPLFQATFFPATKQVKVDAIGEIVNSQRLKSSTYDLDVTVGQNNPQLAYTQKSVKHSIATRWKRGPYWINGTPEQKINIDNNVGYLVDTGLIPNYDRSVKIAELAIIDEYALWMNGPRQIGGNGGRWAQDMSGTGERQDIGPTTGWNARFIFSADWRAREVALGLADLAGAWPLQVREGNPAKFIDKAQKIPGLGRSTTYYARPSTWLFDTRQPGNAADKLVVLNAPFGPYNLDLFNGGGWFSDGAHQPDSFYIPYLLTGDHFYLEQLQFWAGAKSFGGSYGGATIYEQTRGVGWLTRARLNAYALSPDDDPMRGIFRDMMIDTLAVWEGERDIRGTKFENTPAWTAAHNNFLAKQDSWSGYGIGPIHWWQGGPNESPETDGGQWNLPVAHSAGPGWMEDFVIIELGRAVELGFTEARPIFEWQAQNLLARVACSGYSSYRVGEYQTPKFRKTVAGSEKPAEWYPDCSSRSQAWIPSRRDLKDIVYWPGVDTYFSVSRAAAAMVVTLMNRSDIWPIYQAIIEERTAATGWKYDFSSDPRWDIVPRATGVR